MYKITIRILLLGGFLFAAPMTGHAEIFNRSQPKSKEIFNSQKSTTQDSLGEAQSAPSNNTNDGGSNQASTAQGQSNSETAAQPAPNANIYPYYLGAAKYCSHEWSSQECMKTLSGASLVMVSNFAEDLHNKGHGGHLESLKQNCAASTAGTKVEVPAYAQRSAFVTCVNHIVTINEKTGVKPNADFYQLMVGAIMCFDKNQSCAVIERSLDTLLATHNAK